VRAVSPPELVRGLARSFRGWLLAVVALLLVLGIIALGANRPADPSVLPVGPAVTAEARGDLLYAEAHIALGETCLKVLIADTDAKRRHGLMGRNTLPEDINGMLFVNQKDVHDDLTMSQVPIALDAAFFDGRGHRVDTVKMEPCPKSVDQCPRYKSHRKYRYILETAHGHLGAGNLGACTV
jgi:uncharacterized membrane protein (UPF0127 family)